MEMMWGKDRRGLESALYIAQQLVVKRSFPRLLQILIISLIGGGVGEGKVRGGREGKGGREER